MSSKTMTHTDYSSWVILNEVEKGDYTKISQAFRLAAAKLGCRPAQVSSQYYKLRNQGITAKDVENFTVEDEANFDPGDSEPIQRSYDKDKTRSKSPEGYGIPWKGKRGESSEEAEEYERRKKINQFVGENILADETDTVINIFNPMRTIIVIYTNHVLPQSSIGNTKKYAFNTASNVKIGDHIDSPAYTTKLQVVAVLDKPHKYYNSATGELSDTFNSTNQWMVKTLTLRDEESEVVYGTVVNKDRKDRPE